MSELEPRRHRQELQHRCEQQYREQCEPAMVRARSAPSVLVVGPPLDHIGGMASVVQQMCSLRMNGDYAVVHFPQTFSTGGRESLANRAGRHARRVRDLGREIRRNDARIVHIHTCSGVSFLRSMIDMELASRAGCRTVLHIHGAYFDRFYRELDAVRRLGVKWALGRADAVIALSEGWRRALLDMAPSARITVVENAVDMAPVVPERGDSRLVRFLLLARMDRWKGIADLLLAASHLAADRQDFKVTLAGPAGSAGDGDELRRCIADHGLEGLVEYVGPVVGPAKQRLLDESDVYVQPSHHEGMPIAILEAMACGLPVVATDVGAVRELVGDGAGMIVAPRASRMLANAMYRMIEDPKGRRSMALAAREVVARRFSLSRFERDLHDLYDRVLDGPV